MLKRYSVAVLGASIVTVLLILGMNEVAKYFERPDSQVYMRVRDFIPGSGARRLPDRRMPQAQPERAQVDTEAIDAEVPDDLGPARDFTDDPAGIEVQLDLDAASGD